MLESRDITLPTKVHIVKAMVFPVAPYGCESWTIKKAEHQRIDAFELWCWRRLLKVSRTARRSNQSVLRAIDPEYSLEGLMLKLKLQYFGHLRWTVNSLEKTLMLGKIEGRRTRGHQGWGLWMASSMRWTWIWANFRRWWGTGRPGVLQSMGLQRVGHDWETEQKQPQHNKGTFRKSPQITPHLTWKTESLSPKIRNKARKAASVTSFQHVTRSSSQRNLT